MGGDEVALLVMGVQYLYTRLNRVVFDSTVDALWTFSRGFGELHRG